MYLMHLFWHVLEHGDTWNSASVVKKGRICEFESFQAIFWMHTNIYILPHNGNEKSTQLHVLKYNEHVQDIN